MKDENRRYNICADARPRYFNGVWIAEYPSSPGCVSQGHTREEALENVKDNIQICLGARAEECLPLTIETRQVELSK